MGLRVVASHKVGEQGASIIVCHLTNGNYRLINWLFFGQPPRQLIVTILDSLAGIAARIVAVTLLTALATKLDREVDVDVNTETTTGLHIRLHFHDEFSLCAVSLGLHGAFTLLQVLGSYLPSAGGLQNFPLA
jgi:hypothetical protein